MYHETTKLEEPVVKLKSRYAKVVFLLDKRKHKPVFHRKIIRTGEEIPVYDYVTGFTITEFGNNKPPIYRTKATTFGAVEEFILHPFTVINKSSDPAENEKLKKYIGQFSKKTVVNRGHIRLPLVVDAKCKLEQKEFDCVLGDIGVDGVKLFVMTPPEINSNVIVIFDLPDGFGVFVQKQVFKLNN